MNWSQVPKKTKTLGWFTQCEQVFFSPRIHPSLPPNACYTFLCCVRKQEEIIRCSKGIKLLRMPLGDQSKEEASEKAEPTTLLQSKAIALDPSVVFTKLQLHSIHSCTAQASPQHEKLREKIVEVLWLLLDFLFIHNCSHCITGQWACVPSLG